MNDTNKLILAFFLGLAVALGCAYVFMHNSQPKSALVSAASAPVPAAAPVAAPVASPPPSAAPVTNPTPVPVDRPVAGTKQPARAVKKSQPAKPVPQQFAQGHEPSAPPVPDPQPPASTPQSTKPSAAIPAPQSVFNPKPSESAPTEAPHVITLNAGTSLNVRLNETLSSEHNNAGDNFSATLTSPLVVDGFIIADRGSKVQGQVVDADRSGRVKGLANMSLELTHINTTDGQRVHVRTNNLLREANAGKKTDAAKIAGGAAIGALIGGLAGGGKGAAIGAGGGGAAGTGLVLGTRGKDVTFPSETPLTFSLTTPVTITEKLKN